jgi:hypothetical protein
MNAYFHMHRVGVEWVGNSRGMAACICKIWTGQALCLQALRMKLSYMASSPASMHECVTTILWVYTNITTVPAAIVTTILGNLSNMTLTCDNVIKACIFMAKEASLGCALADISQIAIQFKEGLNASEEVPQAAQQSMCTSMAPNLVDFVWQSCCSILQYTNHTSTMLSRYTHSILRIWNSRHEAVCTTEPTASSSVQRGGKGPEAATTIESVTIGTTIEPVAIGTGQSHGAPDGPVDFEVQSRGAQGTTQPRRPQCKEAVWLGRVRRFKAACGCIDSFCSCCLRVKRQDEVQDCTAESFAKETMGNTVNTRLARWRGHDDGKYRCCRSCRSNLRDKSKPHWKPRYTPLNVIHPAIKKLNRFEAALLAAVIPFQRIVTLPTTMQKGLKGHVVCVPSNGQKLEQVLPNDYRPYVMYSGKLLRKVSHRHAYKSGFIRADCLLAAIQAILVTPVYENFQFDASKLQQLEADFPDPSISTSEDDHEGQDAEEDVEEGTEDDSNEIEENQGRAPDMDTCIFENNVDQILDNFSRYNDGENAEVDVEEPRAEGIRVLQPQEIRVAPAEGNVPVPCWQDQDLKAKMFPQVFWRSL